jgi:hypothetical protein
LDHQHLEDDHQAAPESTRALDQAFGFYSHDSKVHLIPEMAAGHWGAAFHDVDHPSRQLGPFQSLARGPKPPTTGVWICPSEGIHDCPLEYFHWIANDLLAALPTQLYEIIPQMHP